VLRSAALAVVRKVLGAATWCARPSTDDLDGSTEDVGVALSVCEDALEPLRGVTRRVGGSIRRIPRPSDGGGEGRPTGVDEQYDAADH
jgi:hypothetical protein